MFRMEKCDKKSWRIVRYDYAGRITGSAGISCFYGKRSKYIKNNQVIL